MRHKYTSNVAFNDLLFNVLVGFVFLFVLAFLLINPPTKKADVPAKAEFMVMLEWADDSSNDIDLWVQFEDTNPVGYRNKENGSLHLERDDLGLSNDTSYINGEAIIVHQNREVIIIRGIIPGDYFVGLHGYNVREVEDMIKVSVIDVNPYREIYTKEVMISTKGERINLPAFTITAEGDVVDIFEHFRNLGPVSSEKAAYQYGNNRGR